MTAFKPTCHVARVRTYTHTQMY